MRPLALTILLGAFWLWIYQGRPPLLVIIIFGVGAVAGALTAIRPPTLTLNEVGFTTESLATLGRPTSYLWADVAEFGVARFGPTYPGSRRRVGIRFTDEHRLAVQMYGHVFAGFDDMLQTTYGLKVEALAEVLEQWRLRHQ